MPLFFRPLCRLAIIALLTLSASAGSASGDIDVVLVGHSDFTVAQEALVEAIESEGMVVGAVLPFREMLTRTRSEAGRQSQPFDDAVIVQFCSAGLAWQMVSEAPEQLAWCPLSISLYSLPGEPGRVRLAYRSPGRATPARTRADDLLHRLVERAAELARLR